MGSVNVKRHLNNRRRSEFGVFVVATAVLVNSSTGSPFPQPKPGDVFRGYLWTNEGGEAGGALRVGGRVGYGGGPVALPHEFDLAHATRAEIVIEKLLCHDGTRGLAISVNSNAWLRVPEASGIPEPPWDYQHHTYPVVPVPMDQLRGEGGNQFRMKVSDEHPWNWPQHLIYGVHFRIYYDSAKKPHPTGHLVLPQPGAALSTKAELEVETDSPNGPIRRVEFLGEYEEVNLEGDGEYVQWHHHYVRAGLTNHIGSVAADVGHRLGARPAEALPTGRAHHRRKGVDPLHAAGRGIHLRTRGLVSRALQALRRAEAMGDAHRGEGGEVTNPGPPPPSRGRSTGLGELASRLHARDFHQRPTSVRA